MKKQLLLIGVHLKRDADWIKQAEHNLEHSKKSLEIGHFDWTCFAAQQAAEMAVKALFHSRGAEAWGHSILKLLEKLPDDITPSEDILQAARNLDRLYIVSRYPNGLPEGTPSEVFDQSVAQEAIANAEKIIRFCRSHMAETI